VRARQRKLSRRRLKKPMSFQNTEEPSMVISPEAKIEKQL
jgi:hypothetical protein